MPRRTDRVRGPRYLVGSGLKEYNETGKVCRHRLETGSDHCQQIAPPIFTPATKEESGHDENISFDG